MSGHGRITMLTPGMSTIRRNGDGHVQGWIPDDVLASIVGYPFDPEHTVWITHDQSMAIRAHPLFVPRVPDAGEPK